jgi:hypothetical protein
MKFQKLVLATSVCAALAGVSGVVNADILGVPGEALLVAPVVSDPAVAGIETNIGLRVPINIGSDTVINYYTAPNTTTEGTVTTQTLDDPRIYWTLFNQRSVKIEDGTCEVSPGDAVLWTTDPAVQGTQAAIRSILLLSGITDRPSPVCGPTNPPRTGYVIFQTISGSDGQVADFAFTADAAISLDGFASDTGVPVVPLADGADPLPPGSGFPAYLNEVIADGPYDNGVPSVPVRYAPVTAGIRFYNGDLDVDEDRVTQMPVQGPVAGYGMAAHVYWFNLNQDGRTAYIDLYDEHEGQCSFPLPVPNELNIHVYNLSHPAVGGLAPLPGSWGNLGAIGVPNTPNRVTDLVALVNGVGVTGGLSPTPYCDPDYWLNYSMFGYAENYIQEYRYPGEPNDGNVHTAGLQYALMQNLGTGFWTGHLATDIGIQ